MNPHPDMMRGAVSNMHQSMMSQQFMPPQPQQGQQTMPHNMGLLQNSQGGNPGLGLMGGQPAASNPNYPLNMQPNRRMFMAPHPNAPALNPAGGAGPSHIAGLPPNQLQSMAGFPGANMQTIRRVQSQPMVGQAGAHGMPGMQSGMQPGMIGGMGLNGQPPMNPIRMTQQQMQMHMRQHQQSSQGGGMSPDNMGMPMNRTGQIQGANGLPPHARTASGQQLMPTLGQQTLQHPHGMPQSMQHNAFANSMPMPHQHQQSQLGSSPHVGSSGQQQPNMAGALAGNPMPQQGPGTRAQMPPDNSMFMSYQNPPLQPQLTHNVPRMAMNNMNHTPFNITPSPAPLNSGGDMPQRGPSSMDASGPLTPAQVIGMGGGDGFPSSGSFGMGAGASAPPRPPSHNGPHSGFPMSQSQPSLSSQQSPRQPHLSTAQMHPPTGVPRPQSQPQAVHRQSPIPPPPSRTPHVSTLPSNAGGMPPPTRIPPPASSQSPQGSTHTPTQPPASVPSGTHPMQIAPRPGTGSGASAGASGPTPSTSAAPPAHQPAAPPERSQPTPAPAPAPPQPPATAPAPAPAPPPPQVQSTSTRQSS